MNLHVRGHFVEMDVTMLFHIVRSVDWQVFIRIHRYQHGPDVRLSKSKKYLSKKQTQAQINIAK